MTTGKEYILFLDETDTHSNNVYFCLAGFIISRKEYEGILIPEINRVKTDILKSPHIIFHYKDMRQQSNGFEFLNDKTVRDKLWTELCSILKNSNIVTLAAYINAVEFRKDYSKIARSEYNVLFNEIINSFVHFLVKNNSVGTVMLESRGVKQNKSTQELYSQMSKCGTNIYNADTIFSRISTLGFNIKKDNSIGLQIADMMPLVFVRNLNNKNNPATLYNTFTSKLYKGNKNDASGYGLIKILR